MALMACPDCGRQVSEKAVSCPACSRPLRGTTTIEQTAKRWKAVQAVGVVGMLLGLSSLFALPRTQTEIGSYLSAAFIALSVAVCIVGRAGAWWYHG